MITTFFGYLEAAYLVGPYMSALANGAIGTQLDQSIGNTFHARTQQSYRIESTDSIKFQLNRRINSGSSTVREQIDRKIADDSTVRSQLNRRIDETTEVRTQLDRRTNSGSFTVKDQLKQQITDSEAVRGQQDRRLAKTRAIASQLDRRISTNSKITRMELKRGSVSHQFCDGYLTEPYLSGPYLAPFICAHLRQQINARLAKTRSIGMQLDRRITTTPHTRMQFDQRITSRASIRMQLLRQATYKLQTQILFAIYNTTNLRILSDFPSRGTSGTNWSVIAGGTTAGDFAVKNVNTDIVEQVYRSTATTITLQCDTQVTQGIFNDTLAILGHNFTSSASVTLQGSNDVTFSSIPLSETLTVESENLYWISEFLPLTSYRYWRILVSDVTNSDGFIEIGTIVFGASIIFNGECFVDEVTRRKTHFADRIRTEGYSSVSNDRALKRAVSLSFRRLDFNRENYQNLVSVIDTARTSLKCLWIPTPQFASRFAVFGKLAEIPVENHKAISQAANYIDLDVNVDEAL